MKTKEALRKMNCLRMESKLEKRDSVQYSNSLKNNTKATVILNAAKGYKLCF